MLYASVELLLYSQLPSRYERAGQGPGARPFGRVPNQLRFSRGRRRCAMSLWSRSPRPQSCGGDPRGSVTCQPARLSRPRTQVPHKLSGNVQQRMNLAAPSPSAPASFLVVDEPFVALDARRGSTCRLSCSAFGRGAIRRRCSLHARSTKRARSPTQPSCCKAPRAWGGDRRECLSASPRPGTPVGEGDQ